ncbi:MAG: 3-hydroxyacyl-[acyl-carrier-protein] dehydratase FabZ, partial [Victivallales bacterium]|nr:3-hydroxyacyl-[acyl-carrier-protein] dehydratase FabZ [Victivallales bacterium]
MKLLGPKEIKEILPHRYPMLMIDRAMIESDTKVTAVKNITFNEVHFHG